MKPILLLQCHRLVTACKPVHDLTVQPHHSRHELHMEIGRVEGGEGKESGGRGTVGEVRGGSEVGVMERSAS